MKKPRTKKRVSTLQVINTKQKITNTTLSEIGMSISKMLDLMNDPKFKDENFRKTLSQSKNHFSIAAASGEVFISFNVEFKGAGL